ncbi:MAG: DUF4168 domain-containing protein, partial [Cyanobacteria bacterium J06639_1]
AMAQPEAPEESFTESANPEAPIVELAVEETPESTASEGSASDESAPEDSALESEATTPIVEPPAATEPAEVLNSDEGNSAGTSESSSLDSNESEASDPSTESNEATADSEASSPAADGTATATPAPRGNARELGTPAQNSAPKPLTAADITDEQVEQLARSLLAIQPLLIAANREIQNAGSPTEQREIEQSFETQAIAIVTREGLSVEQYRELLMLADRNPEFEQRVSAQLDDLQGEAAAQ